jgi:putative molybdopterin biosynthesis protein
MTRTPGTRNVYLEDTPREEAVDRFIRTLADLGYFSFNAETDSETIPVQDARGRLTSGPVFARLSHPHYRASAMDGYAVVASTTFGASEVSPVRLKPGDDAVLLDTGDVVPEACDAVIRIEDINPVNDQELEIIAPVHPYQNVRQIGEDIAAGDMIIPRGKKITPFDQGALIAGGHTAVRVRRVLRIGIIPTGDELVAPGAPRAPGDIVEFNSVVLAGLAAERDAAAHVYPVQRDDPGQIGKTVLEAVGECDIVLINAGSSAGRDDYTRRIIEESGVLVTHGVAVKPGHPVVLGAISGIPIIGVPGYPVSAALSFDLFVTPVLRRKLGLDGMTCDTLDVIPTRPVYSPLGLEEQVRVRIGRIGGAYVASPLHSGAGVIMSLARADGILTVPRLSEGVEPDRPVPVVLLRSRKEIDDSVVISGSHDMTLDLLNDLMHGIYPGYSVTSSNLGSMGGISALRRREAHCAGMHLLDPDSGEYNVPFIRKFLSDLDVVLVNLVYREQGFIVESGNPRNLRSIEDLREIRFMNRQKGSGTRILLDIMLKEADISSEDIYGYHREEYTHLAVAAAVASGTADAGLGIKAAAVASGLSFVPLVEERYDLCIPRTSMTETGVQKLLGIVRSDDFRQAAEPLGGYSTRDSGTVVYG